MARRRKKKSLSGLGALAIDPKIMLGGLLVVGVAAYFLLRKKDDEANASTMPTDAMMSQGNMAPGSMAPGSTGTPVDTSAPAPAASGQSPLLPAVQQNPVIRERLRNLNISPIRTSSIAAKLGIP